MMNTKEIANKYMDDVINGSTSKDEDTKYYSEREIQTIFEHFDKYSCIKNDKWYLELKEHFLKTGKIKNV